MKVIFQLQVTLEDDDLKALAAKWGRHWPENRFPRAEVIACLQRLLGMELSRLKIEVL